MVGNEYIELDLGDYEDAYEDDLQYEPILGDGQQEDVPIDAVGTGYVFGRVSERGESAHRPQSLRVDEMTPHELGSIGEEIAAHFLKQKGLEVVERNWMCPCGEADIICKDEQMYVLVEVKTRLSDDIAESMPELAVTSSKRDIYRRIAACFMNAYGLSTVRFDVIGISVDTNQKIGLRYFKNAFGGED